MKSAIVVVFIFIFSFAALADNGPYVPSQELKTIVRFEKDSDYIIASSADKFQNYNVQSDIRVSDSEGLNMINIRKNQVDLKIYQANEIWLNRYSYNDYPRMYLPSVARYYSISLNPGFLSALSGGATVGLGMGIDKYMNYGVIDIASSVKATALMTGSSYVGVLTTNVMNSISAPLFSTYSGAAFAGAVGSAAGATAAGALFAVGAYYTNTMDVHSARLLAAKSALGSTVIAGTTALLGTSTITTGIFAIGTFALPYIGALGVIYAVDKYFEAADREEEKQRVTDILHNIKVIR